VPGEIPPGGIPGQGIPAGGGIPPGGIPFGEDQTSGGIPTDGIPPGGIPFGEDQTSGGIPADGISPDGIPPDGMPSSDEQASGSAMPSGDTENDEEPLNSQCTYLDIENITANGFETDPADFHPPSDAIDGSSSTWWSYNGDNPWIDISLYGPQSICGVYVQWNKGNERSYTFEIEVSQDGNTYEKIFEGHNKKGSTASETYSFPDIVEGKFVKLTVTSTSSNDGWASIQEISALGSPLNNETRGSSGIPPGGIPIDNQTTMPADNQTDGNGVPPKRTPLDDFTKFPINNLTKLPLKNLTKLPVNNQTTNPVDDQKLKE
jgi:hypothetical protein